MGEYKLLIEPRHGLLRMTLSGFFSLEDVAAIDTDRIAALRRLGCAPNQHVTLCDIREMKISSQDVVVAFARIAQDRRYASRRLAMVNTASLARLQAQRVATSDNVAYFTDLAKAERWLME